MSRSTQHPGLNGFAWLTAVSTFALIGLGGLVTSKGAGMAVPDWPTTYGYNMFLFPIRLWMGGIFYEHTHRLFASFVGLLTVILATWLWVRESRRWLRWLGVVAVVAVIVQGVLGGLRVTLFKDEIGIVHATLAQLFFVLVGLIALFASKRHEKLVSALHQIVPSPWLRRVTLATTILVLVQLIIGASMRHQHAGLAIPDFPLAYGQLWPPMDSAFIAKVNRERIALQDYNPITTFQIGLHMAHRVTALAILVLVCGLAWVARRRNVGGPVFKRWTMAWAILIACQAALGALTVWSNKAADVATAHVLLGAASLLVGAVLSVVLLAARAHGTAMAPSPTVRPYLNATLMEPKPNAT